MSSSPNIIGHPAITAKSDLLCRIAQSATAFRLAIEGAEKKSWGGSFSHFPRQCCGPASEMLGTYLANKYNREVLFVYGFSHAWIECDGFVIDITSDQFTSGNPTVIVTSNIVDHYRRFAPDECYPLVQLPWETHRKWRWCRQYRDMLSYLEPDWPIRLFPPDEMCSTA